jgi:hypothetical protein
MNNDALADAVLRDPYFPKRDVALIADDVCVAIAEVVHDLKYGK